MDRRRFVVFIGGALLLPALAAAQSGRRPRIGFLALPDAFASGAPNRFGWAALESELGKLGYHEGGNVDIERRHASGVPARLKEAAGKLVDLKADVIVTFGAQSVTATSRATGTVPIVSYTNDLVALGLAASFARPGGNVTGVSPSTSTITIKQFEILRELVPGARRVAWLRNPSNAIFTTAFGKEMEAAGATLGASVKRFDAASADELDAAVREIAEQGFDAVVVPADVMFVQHRARLAAQLLQHRLPSASLDKVMLDAGMLMTYGVDVLDGIRRMATHVDKILRGTPAGEIPIEFIERFQFGINLRTAKALGLTIPKTVFLRADRVIE